MCVCAPCIRVCGVCDCVGFTLRLLAGGARSAAFKLLVTLLPQCSNTFLTVSNQRICFVSFLFFCSLFNTFSVVFIHHHLLSVQTANGYPSEPKPIQPTSIQRHSLFGVGNHSVFVFSSSATSSSSSLSFSARRDNTRIAPQPKKSRQNFLKKNKTTGKFNYLFWFFCLTKFCNYCVI